MTVEEMANKIANECHKHPMCKTDDWTCPLYGSIGTCYEDEELVEQNYNLMFPSGSQKAMEVDKLLHEMDAVNHPHHYTNGSIECIDAMVAAYGKDAVAEYCIINAFKYIWRSEHKNGLEDIKKAVWYLNKHIELKESTNE